MTKREFLGPEFHAFVQREFDEARHYLKNCGRPKDEVDRYMIQHHRTTVEAFRRLL